MQPRAAAQLFERSRKTLTEAASSGAALRRHQPVQLPFSHHIGPPAVKFVEVSPALLIFFILFPPLFTREGFQQMPGENEGPMRARRLRPSPARSSKFFRPTSSSARKNPAEASFIDLLHTFSSEINLYPSFSIFFSLFYVLPRGTEKERQRPESRCRSCHVSP